MAAGVTSADASLPPKTLSELLWSTDPKLNGFMFQTEERLHRILSCEWPAEGGLLCHRFAFTIMDEAQVSGLLIGHTAEEYGRNFEAAKVLQVAAMTSEESSAMVEALFWMDRLFPAPREQSYYVLELAVAAKAQGGGLASALLSAAEERATRQGCTHICLDVAADNEAVGFYKHLGYVVEIETRVPYLAEDHGIGTHLHMVKPLELDQ